MCGIAGIFNLDGAPVLPSDLRRMTDAIAHRGPDSEGFYIDSFVGLGHRRLSILDLSRNGHQPMKSENGMCVISYNGEVYNYLELKAELIKKGYNFRSTSDTEVVLYSYFEWGEECVSKFNGMFSLVIWDKRNQSLFISRDRYGIKPLYYGFIDNTFLFGSEQKAILSNDSFEREIDHEALLEYFTFQNLFTDKTLIKGINLFPAGSWARIELGSLYSNLQIHQYWDFQFEEPKSSLREEHYSEELDFLFNQAVRRQLVSDVPVGAYLSGGIDSGAITAVAAREMPWMTSFTCGFDLNSASGMELAFDEREMAEYMSYIFKTEHYEMVLKAGDMERVMKKLVFHLEEPRVGQSYPNFYISQLASKFVKVVLAGTGGDELFGGYPWRYYRAVVNNDFEDYIDKYYVFWQRLIPNKKVKEVFAPIWNNVDHVWTRDIFRDVFKRNTGSLNNPTDYLNHSLYFEAKTFLHGLLIVEDKLSMAHGLENRVPFLDNDLVDFAMSLPAAFKLGNLEKVVEMNENEPGPKTKKYFMKSKDGKLLLRKVLEKYVTSAITNLPKQGFSAPDAGWFKGESIEYIRDKFASDSAHIYNYLNKKAISGLINEHMDGKQNRRLLIWSLLCFDEWLDCYMN